MEKNDDSYTAMRTNAGGVACKPGLQASAIWKASLHADHPPLCLKYCVSAQYLNTAMLLSAKRRGIISVIILFYLLSIQC